MTSVQIKLFRKNFKGYKDTLKGYRLSLIEIKDELMFSDNEKNIFIQ